MSSRLKAHRSRLLLKWEKAHALALEVYHKTKDFPAEERYELTRQIRRCAVSIPTNIAEGCGRGSDAELARFLQIARGSASELEYTLLLARELGMLKAPAYEALAPRIEEVQRMLAALIKKLTAQSS